MRIEAADLEIREAVWDQPGWPWENRNTNPMDAYEDSAYEEPKAAVGRRTVRQTFVRIRAEGITARYGPIDSYAAAVAQDVLLPWLTGQDASRIVELNDRMQRLSRHGRSGVFMTAVAAVDLCLWQLKGQAVGEPLYRMLGGPCRDTVPAYASMLGFSIEPERAAQRAAEAKAQGYPAQKWFFRYGPAHGNEGFRRNIEMAKAVRRAVGEGYRLMFDAFCAWTGPYAIQMCQALEEVSPFWVEEPLPPEDLASWERLRRATRVPLAAGEHLHSRRTLLPFLREGLLDVLQCDPEWAGGVTEMQAILHTAGGFGVPVYPHGHTLLPAIHLAAAHPPTVLPMVEHLLNIQPERYALFAEPPKDEGGRFALPTKPGLGVELVDSPAA